MAICIPNILTDEKNKEEMKRVEAAIDEMFAAALALGGTLSGEHGIGIIKQKYMDVGVRQGRNRRHAGNKKGA